MDKKLEKILEDVNKPFDVETYKEYRKIVTLRSISEGLWDAYYEYKEGKISAYEYTEKVFSLMLDIDNYGSALKIFFHYVEIPYNSQLKDCVRVIPMLEEVRNARLEEVRKGHVTASTPFFKPYP